MRLCSRSDDDLRLARAQKSQAHQESARLFRKVARHLPRNQDARIEGDKLVLTALEKVELPLKRPSRHGQPWCRSSHSQAYQNC
jgi:hypothetical protein